jgi:hypothetical protein
MIRIKINVDVISSQGVILLIWEIIGNGRRIVISTSKIRKMMAIRKNRRENGIRLDENGSNPHSKGEDFSRLDVFFFLSREAAIMTIIETIRVNSDDMIIGRIIFLIVINLMFGRHLYLIY